VTTPSPAPKGGASRPLRRLLAAVRPQFRADEFVFDAADEVFSSGACRVGGCVRRAQGRGMCQGHNQRWVKQGRPDVDTFIAGTDSVWQRQRPNQVCRADECGYGVARQGLCQLHAQRWVTSGRPDVEKWVLDPLPVKRPAPGAVCQIPHCSLWPQASSPFCHAHFNAWRANGREDIALFIARFTEPRVLSDERIDLTALPPRLKLEIQYALQRRHEERATKTPPLVVMQVVRMLAVVGDVSLLDRSEDEWRVSIGRPAPLDSNPRALLVYARRQVEDLVADGGWEAEYPNTVWHLHRLGYPGRRTFTFDGIRQPWLREHTKRWTRWRLSTGLGLEASRRSIRAATRFSRFLTSVGIGDINQIDRAVLERYLADLHNEMGGSHRQGDHIGQLNALFAAIRQHRWEPALPAGAVFFGEDYPKRPERLPRALAEQVMNQLEHDANLDRWDNPGYRLLTLILMNCGLRVTDAARLHLDCVITDADGAPYLKYFNHKMKREALVPIDEQLRGLIGEQRRRSTTRWPQTQLLFPRPTKNVDGTEPISSSTYRLALYRWLDACEIRDEHGHPVQLTPHQWRHTLGTRMINRDVPQEVVRRLLDHDSHAMTAHYARLHDSTVRKHWEAARKVNASGQDVSIEPDGPLAEAAWSKHRLGRATQALPNGFCGLPVRNSCPHANACLTCPTFITTAEFLPQHREQRQQTVQIINSAEARGHQRVIEMNQQILSNLDAIITTLTEDEGDGDDVPEADADAG